VSTLSWVHACMLGNHREGKGQRCLADRLAPHQGLEL
jgi:hypothetical protein